MGRGRLFFALVSITLVAAAIGYVVATAVFAFRLDGLSADIDFTMLARSYTSLSREDAMMVNLIVGGFGLAGLMLSSILAGDTLTRFGETHWQTNREMKKNGFFAPMGTGFVLGKTTKPGGSGMHITSKVFPHAMVVAPTGRGKTVGFAIPNLLAFKGSAVCLDVKGELFDETARHRLSEGDKVYRFAPTDWRNNRTHRYNPLQRIFEMDNANRQQMELQLLATLFLQADNDRVQGLLKGGIDLFVASGMLAFERGIPTLGEIYRIAASGGDKQKEYNARRLEVKNPAARLIFERLASTNNDTLTSYVSLLMTSGLDQWSNPAIDDATARSDFDFRTIRKKPFTVYIVVEPLMVKPLAALIRLLFSDLLASLQDHQPGKDEPWPVMILLDEFNRLGKMPIVADSIETLRSYRGHLALITQTIPALDEIYGENTRRALQGNAGVKLYLTPSDEKTVEELSGAVGTTTRRVVMKSRAITRNPFAGRSTSERTEEMPLLTEDDARRMPLDDIIMVIDAQMPIRAKRIEYFKDRHFKRVHAAQTGDFPWPEPVQLSPAPVESPEVSAEPKMAGNDRSEEALPATIRDAAETTLQSGRAIRTRKKRSQAIMVHQGRLDLAMQTEMRFGAGDESAAAFAEIEEATGSLSALIARESGQGGALGRSAAE